MFAAANRTDDCGVGGAAAAGCVDREGQNAGQQRRPRSIGVASRRNSLGDTGQWTSIVAFSGSSSASGPTFCHRHRVSSLIQLIIITHNRWTDSNTVSPVMMSAAILLVMRSR